MTERAGAGRWTLTAAVALAAALLAVLAAGRAREGVHTAAAPFEEVDLATLPPLPSPIGDRAFWIGGWVGPRVGDRSPATWRTHEAAGLDISMGPLEDRYRRADNVARLAFLDSLRAADIEQHEQNDVPFVFVRDDSLHPDEATRPGWEARIDAIVRDYGKARSLAGYFLADEPTPGDLPVWSAAARRLRALDPAHPAYVNFLPIAVTDAANPAAATRWRADVEASIAAGQLPLFTFSAYPFGAGDERPHFLATLREAARVSHATGRPFGVVLQWTGHGELREVTAAEALYQATQALAHGASGITWFTYVTPDPSEEPWHWHGGAIAYDGTRTARFDTMATINAHVRALAEARGTRAMRAVHLGGGLPEGFAMGTPPNMSRVVSVSGGPATLGATAEVRLPGDLRERRFEQNFVLANRDRSRKRTYRIEFKHDTTGRQLGIESLAGPPISKSKQSVYAVVATVDLEPGDAAVFRVTYGPGPNSRTPGRDPRTPSRSGTR